MTFQVYLIAFSEIGEISEDCAKSNANICDVLLCGVASVKLALSLSTGATNIVMSTNWRQVLIH